MKKAIILVLLMVLSLGGAALAAEVKVGGEARYILTFPKSEEGAPDWSDAAQYRIKISADLNETTSALIYFRSKPTTDKAHIDTVYNAQLTTKLAGVGTLTLGQDYNDYGSAPFANFGTVWGNTGDKGTGILFATEEMGGISGQVFWAPKAEDHFVAGEVNYALPFLEGSTVGLAAYRQGDGNPAFAGTALVKLSDAFSVYGELGKTDSELDECDAKTIGAKAVLGNLTLYGESDVAKKQNYFQVTVPFQGVSLNAAYQCGQGYEKTWDSEAEEWVNAGEDGKITVWAKVVF
ncbi:MAG: hypothetical protein ACM3RP_02010 [Chitinophagales bacterium]